MSVFQNDPDFVHDIRPDYEKMLQVMNNIVDMLDEPPPKNEDGILTATPHQYEDFKISLIAQVQLEYSYYFILISIESSYHSSFL